MPRKTENVGSETSPHPNSSREGVIKDATGVQIGVRSDVDTEEFRQQSNKDKQLEKFEEITKGD